MASTYISELALKDLGNYPSNAGKDANEVFGSSECMIRALRNNPFAEDKNLCAQVLGYVDGHPAGAEYRIPLLFKARGEVYKQMSGSSLHVKEEYRKYELGVYLLMAGFPKQYDVAVGGGLSQMALPLARLRKRTVFEFPRMVMLSHSRSVVEMLIKGWIGVLLSKFIDLGLMLYRSFLRGMLLFAFRGCNVTKVEENEEDKIKIVEGIIGEDSHPYCEYHNAEWIKWLISESFSIDGPAQLFIVAKRGVPIAFYMAKKRFHKQASHRGFKNVWLGSIIEWGSINGYEKKIPWMMVMAALKLSKDCDAVELATPDIGLVKFVRRIGWARVGSSNCVFKVQKNSALQQYKDDMDNIDNWRIRPAIGDNGIN